MNFLDSRISVFKDSYAKATDAPKMNITVRDALEHFRTGRMNRHNVEKAREAYAAGDEATSKKYKKLTLCYCFSALLKGNSKEKGLQHSGLIQCDWDPKDGFDFAATWERLVNDPHVVAVFRSTRGEGIKALIAVDLPPAPTDAYHKQAVRTVQRRYNSPGFDTSLTDLNRYCYGTVDPEIYINPNAVPLLVEYGEDPAASFKPPSERREYDEVIPHGEKYDFAGVVAGALRRLNLGPGLIYSAVKEVLETHGETPIDDYGKLQKLCEDIGNKPVDEGTSWRTFIRSNLSGPELYVGGDGALVDDPPEDNAATVKFWYFEKPGGKRSELKDEVAKIDQSLLVDFLAARGFAKFYELDSQSSTFIRARGYVLERVAAEQMKDHVLRFAETLDPRVLDALRKGANVYFSRYLLECLPVLEPHFQRGTADTAYFYFRNVFVCVTGEGAQVRPYSELQGYIWRSQIIDRGFTPLAADEVAKAEFRRFRWNAMRKNEGRFWALNSTIGYLLHDYKDPSNAKAICYVDEVISDVPSGRAGKSLVGRAIAQMVPSVHIDARNFRFDTPFAFQQVNASTRVVAFNDASEHFPFDRMFTPITDDFPIEQKNQPRLSIPFESSPKFLLSTNYVIEGQGGSHEDRIFEVEFSDHYNARHKPVDEFGHRFFDGWDATEWNLFYNDMLDCVCTYLRRGLYTYKHINLAHKKFAQATCPEFAEYAARFKANRPGTTAVEGVVYERLQIIADLTKEYGLELTPHKLTRFMKEFAEYRGWELRDRLGKKKDQYAFVDRTGDTSTED